MGTLDSLLQEHGSDLNKLVDKFESSGMGDKVKSWIGTGPNESIEADDIKNALGREVGELAAKLGIGEDEAAEKLAQELPDAVDKATPNGTLPGPNEATEQAFANQTNGRER
jgi:uncharacterized protein YidB (DUF937 family)